VDVTNHQLKYAVKSAAGWQTQSVAGFAVGSGSCSLVIDKSGKPHVAFTGAGSSSLMYATIPNNKPHAVADGATTDEDTAVDINVLANDSDPDGDPVAVSAVTQPAHGTAAVNDNGTVRYTPAANFTYTITDGVAVDTAAVSVSVNPVNDPPKVWITTPYDGSIFSAGSNVTITVYTSDVDSNVTKVEFYQGTTLLGTSQASPFNFLWTGVPGGTCSLIAKAYDEQGAVTASEPVTIVVTDPGSNPPGSGGTVFTPGPGCFGPAMVLIGLLVAGFSLLYVGTDRPVPR
jgi:hypothetical protein